MGEGRREKGEGRREKGEGEEVEVEESLQLSVHVVTSDNKEAHFLACLFHCRNLCVNLVVSSILTTCSLLSFESEKKPCKSITGMDMPVFFCVLELL
jgi:hypothetical protein